MNLRFAMLAEAAVSHPDGKLYLLGAGGDVVRAEGDFPWQPNALAVVFRIDFEPTEIGHPKKLSVSALDSHGRAISEPATYTLVPEERTEATDLAPSVGVVVQTRGLTIPRSGDYEFVIKVDGKELGRVFARIEGRAHSRLESAETGPEERAMSVGLQYGTDAKALPRTELPRLRLAKAPSTGASGKAAKSVTSIRSRRKPPPSEAQRDR